MQTQEPQPKHDFPTPDPLMQWSMVLVFLMGLGKRLWDRLLEKDKKEDEIIRAMYAHTMKMNELLLSNLLKSQNAK